MFHSHNPRLQLLIAPSLLAMGLAAPVARATDLSSNLANATSGVEIATASRWLAGSFGTDGSAPTLSSVTLLLANPTPGAAELYLYSDGNLEPGALLGTLTAPASYSATLAATTFTAGAMTLEADSTYWIVLAPLDGEFEWAWTADNSGEGAGFLHTWGISEDGGAFWWCHDIYQTQFQAVVDACAGDTNGDDVVNVSDLLAVIISWGSCTGCPADVDDSGSVDVTDLLAVVIAWGSCP